MPVLSAARLGQIQLVLDQLDQHVDHLDVQLLHAIGEAPNRSTHLDLRQPGVAQLLWLGAEQGLDSWFAGETALADLFARFEGIERLRVLMALPTLESIFSQLAVEQDTAAISRHIVELVVAS